MGKIYKNGYDSRFTNSEGKLAFAEAVVSQKAEFQSGYISCVSLFIVIICHEK